MLLIVSVSKAIKKIGRNWTVIFIYSISRVWKKKTRNNKRKANWIGHILRRNCLLQRVIEGTIKGGYK